MCDGPSGSAADGAAKEEGEDIAALPAQPGGHPWRLGKPVVPLRLRPRGRRRRRLRLGGFERFWRFSLPQLELEAARKTGQERLAQNQIVIVHGLAGAPQLNGLAARALRFVEEKGRYIVLFPSDGSQKLLRPDNLRPLATDEAKVQELLGLASRAAAARLRESMEGEELGFPDLEDCSRCPTFLCWATPPCPNLQCPACHATQCPPAAGCPACEAAGERSHCEAGGAAGFLLGLLLGLAVVSAGWSAALCVKQATVRRQPQSSLVNDASAGAGRGLVEGELVIQTPDGDVYIEDFQAFRSSDIAEIAWETEAGRTPTEVGDDGTCVFGAFPRGRTPEERAALRALPPASSDARAPSVQFNGQGVRQRLRRDAVLRIQEVDVKDWPMPWPRTGSALARAVRGSAGRGPMGHRRWWASHLKLTPADFGAQEHERGMRAFQFFREYDQVDFPNLGGWRRSCDAARMARHKPGPEDDPTLLAMRGSAVSIVPARFLLLSVTRCPWERLVASPAAVACPCCRGQSDGAWRRGGTAQAGSPARLGRPLSSGAMPAQTPGRPRQSKSDLLCNLGESHVRTCISQRGEPRAGPADASELERRGLCSRPVEAGPGGGALGLMFSSDRPTVKGNSQMGVRASDLICFCSRDLFAPVCTRALATDAPEWGLGAMETEGLEADVERAASFSGRGGSRRAARGPASRPGGRIEDMQTTGEEVKEVKMTQEVGGRVCLERGVDLAARSLIDGPWKVAKSQGVPGGGAGRAAARADSHKQQFAPGECRQGSAAQRGPETAHLSYLQAASARPGARQLYLASWRMFVEWAKDHRPPLTSECQVGNAKYFEALRGWSLKCRGMSRLPTPWEVVRLHCDWLVGEGYWSMAAAVLMCAVFYLTPSEALGLLRCQLAPPLTFGGQRRSRWTAILRPMELGQPSKVNKWGDSRPLDLHGRLTEQLHYLPRGVQLAAGSCASEIGAIMNRAAVFVVALVAALAFVFDIAPVGALAAVMLVMVVVVLVAVALVVARAAVPEVRAGAGGAGRVPAA
ncbi:unnamed protein product [Prorocentrum cordatum]|uniref:Uncharacterized protein n=1 Tax=Prorocentrum cordatum TaxID=2364126 RepID=A0ABN9WVH5_9DINO|nr:unnamed protein product [Polarella glacialis]